MVYAYSIAHSQRQKANTNCNPGPGAYELSQRVKNQSPNWKRGQSQRGKWEKNQNPGPGWYDVQHSFDSKQNKCPAYVFGTKNQQTQQNQVPGQKNKSPGAYESNYNFHKNPSYSLRPKFSDQTQDKNSPGPGPGYYETNISTILNKSSPKIGTSQRDQYYMKNIGPGPGQYVQIAYKATLPSYGFGTEERQNNFKPQKNANIGPGTYQLKSTIRTDIGNSISPRINNDQTKKQNTMVGPDTYNPSKNKILIKSPAFKIGKSKRNDFSPKNNNPGPGNYNPFLNQIKAQSPQCKIGCAKRQDLNYKMFSPGPGSYNEAKAYENLQKGAQYTMVPRRPDYNYSKEKRQTPGPDKYQINLSLTKSRVSTYKIGKGNRPNTSQTYKYNPGPGRYETPSKIGNQTQGFTFGKEERIKSQMHQDLPGPGNYELKPFTDDIPSYAINRDQLKIKL